MDLRLAYIGLGLRLGFGLRLRLRLGLGLGLGLELGLGLGLGLGFGFGLGLGLGLRLRQRRSSRPPNPQLGGPRPTLGAQVSLKLLFGYVTIFSSADLFTTDLNCRKKLACDIISECNVILFRRI